MNKYILVACLLLSACGHRGISSPVSVTIYNVVENKSKLGCIGTDFETYVQADDGRVGKLCGNWGKPGMKLTGVWISGATGDYEGMNGFTLHD